MIRASLYSDQEVGDLEYELMSEGCRMCGSDERPFVVSDGRVFMSEGGLGECWSEGPFRVRCDNCNREGPWRKTPRQAIAAWKRMKMGACDKASTPEGRELGRIQGYGEEDDT